MRAVILQPMYLPWIGYFNLIDQSDVFVFLDDVQFSVQSWQQRNKIKTSQGWLWLTVPILREFGSKIKEIKVNNNINWSKKHWASVRQNYSKAPYFKEYSKPFEEIYSQEWEYLADLDITLIKVITTTLGLKTEFVLSSELAVEGEKTERVINILEKLGASEYISGPAAKSYIEVEKFTEAGITLYWHEYEHPVYPQLYGEFIPYLSVIDLLFNCGPESKRYIRKGGENALKKAN